MILSSRDRLFVQVCSGKWLVLQGTWRAHGTGYQRINFKLHFQRLIAKFNVFRFARDLRVFSVPELYFEGLKRGIVKSFPVPQNNSSFLLPMNTLQSRVWILSSCFFVSHPCSGTCSLMSQSQPPLPFLLQVNCLDPPGIIKARNSPIVLNYSY